MRKSILLAALLLAAAFAVKAQETFNDTVIDGNRYIVFTGLSGTDYELHEAYPMDEAAIVADLNNRLRSIAIYQTIAVPCAIASPFVLSLAYGGNPLAGFYGQEAVYPSWAVIGYGMAAASVVCGVLSYAKLWTNKVYATQNGIIVRLGNKKN